MALVIEHLPSMLKTLCSIPSTKDEVGKSPFVRRLLLGLMLKNQGQHRQVQNSHIARKDSVARVFKTITAQSLIQVKDLCLHQLQVFCWTTKGSNLLLAWVKMTVGSATVN
jgi:hypothetical protein